MNDFFTMGSDPIVFRSADLESHIRKIGSGMMKLFMMMNASYLWKNHPRRTSFLS